MITKVFISAEIPEPDVVAGGARERAARAKAMYQQALATVQRHNNESTREDEDNALRFWIEAEKEWMENRARVKHDFRFKTTDSDYKEMSVCAWNDLSAHELLDEILKLIDIKVQMI